jgi:ABC-type multidrug transport system ATPase subunit
VILRTMSHRVMVLTTHITDEVEYNRVGIMSQGQHLKTKFDS